MTKKPLLKKMTATGTTESVSLKNVIPHVTCMATIHAGKNTAGTTVAATSVLNGIQLVKMTLVIGSGKRMLALKAKTRNGRLLSTRAKSLINSLNPLKHTAPTVHAES